ncbi:flagellar basal body rod C-terminal domain-containing protein [Shewanella gaetbuli]|uniref:Chemotaxis protein n=1 Tax=Shewanella gaetbuli TaxID=220752 RepID=A0A9X1ZK12_9GAMM|nr:flagellar basal body rod C-terminal domain-containing protein [Shewanella gaetbuli]MCL1143153.1 chemotaxis protein [Shewanella gaetbuli]
MNVQSAYSSGVQGLQSSQQGLAQATTAVAAPETQASTTPTVQEDTVTLSSQSTQSVDKNEAIVSAIESVQQGEASAKVIQAADNTVGSIIDIEV